MKRTASVSGMKGHTSLVSKMDFARDRNEGVAKAVSCGFDSTVRGRNVVTGAYVTTIVSVSFSPSPAILLNWHFRVWFRQH